MRRSVTQATVKASPVRAMTTARQVSAMPLRGRLRKAARVRPSPLKRSGALKGRRKEWIPGPGETRAARCCVVAWCWSACGLLARPARRSLEAAKERVQASGEPFVAVACPHVLAQGGQRRGTGRLATT